MYRNATWEIPANKSKQNIKVQRQHVDNKGTFCPDNYFPKCKMFIY